jgi:hypothetical protein
MSNNSLPSLSDELVSRNNKNANNVVPRIYARMKEYLACDGQIKLLKLVVVRQYMHCMLLMLKANHGRNATELMQLKTILNSKIINDMEYPLQSRMCKFLVFLNMVCDENSDINKLVGNWDDNVLYF